MNKPSDYSEALAYERKKWEQTILLMLYYIQATIPLTGGMVARKMMKKLIKTLEKR